MSDMKYDQWIMFFVVTVKVEHYFGVSFSDGHKGTKKNIHWRYQT